MPPLPWMPLAVALFAPPRHATGSTFEQSGLIFQKLTKTQLICPVSYFNTLGLETLFVDLSPRRHPVVTLGAVETLFLNFRQNKSTLLFIYTSFIRSNILFIEGYKVQAGGNPTSGVERGSAVVQMNSQKF